MIISNAEKNLFKYLLPVYASLEDQGLHTGINEKLQFEADEEIVEFSKDEISFLKKMITILDNMGKIHIDSIPLIRKITKE